MIKILHRFIYNRLKPRDGFDRNLDLLLQFECLLKRVKPINLTSADMNHPTIYVGVTNIDELKTRQDLVIKHTSSKFPDWRRLPGMDQELRLTGLADVIGYGNVEEQRQTLITLFSEMRIALNKSRHRSKSAFFHTTHGIEPHIADLVEIAETWLSLHLSTKRSTNFNGDVERDFTKRR